MTNHEGHSENTYNYQNDIEALRQEIDWIDSVIIAYVQRRTAVSRQIGELRTSNGGFLVDSARELEIQERYAELGESGDKLADAVLELGRGKFESHTPRISVRELMKLLGEGKVTIDQVAGDFRTRPWTKHGFESSEEDSNGTPFDNDMYWIADAYDQKIITGREYEYLFDAIADAEEK